MKKTTATLLVALALSATTSFARTEITALKVQNAESPIAIEDRHPLFSWQMSSDERGQRQTAYQVKVTRRSDSSLLWDTGRVDSDRSVGVRYEGVALQPEMGYDVSVTVWDKDGAAHEASSSFETSLMSPRIKAWGGAQWIGSHAKKLDAQSQCVYSIKTGFTVLKGGKAALVFGADDFRLSDKMFNDKGIQGRHYVKVEIDLSGVGTAKGAELNICRVGFDRGDSAEKPLYTVNAELFPQTNINEIITAENASSEHTLQINVEVSDVSFILDGKALVSEPRRGNWWAFKDFSVGMMNAEIPASRFRVGPYGSGGDYPSFPNMCSVGFAAAPGSEVIYSDYQLLNAGRSEDKVVFDSDRYALFEGLDGVSVEGGEIRVSNAGSAEVLGWKDPSYGATTMLRSEFSTAEGRKIKSARLYATAMGIYNFYINGQKVGDAWFAPGDSQYRETMGYHKYDVTQMLREGRNALGAQLAGGWYTGYMTFTASNFNFFGDYDALLSRLVVTYEDGGKEVFVSSPGDWKAFNDGPIRMSNFFHGERYDATKEAAISGWTEVGYDDSAWAPAEVIEQRDWVDFDLMARYDEPVRVRETLSAKKVAPTHGETTYIYDMGVNMVGVPSVTIPAGWLKPGDKVVFAFGEQLYPGLKGDKKEYVARFGRKGRGTAGQILFESNRAAINLDFYTASSSDEVTIQPSMTFRGYQYIQISIPSHKGPLPLENVKGVVLSSCEVPTGTYSATTSDGRTGELANQLFRNIQRSQLGNFLTIPTDCPQRNERMGWTGDAQAYTRTGTYNADLHNFFRQWMVALRADQGIGSDTEVPGGIGSTVPTYNMQDDPTFANGTTWAAAVCQVPWQLYSQYGDTQIIEENLETMMDWLNGMAFYKTSDAYPHLSGRASGLADHLAMDNRTPADLLNNAIYIHMMEVTAVMAQAVGREDLAKTLRDRHDAAKAEWNRAYVNPETGRTRSLEGRPIHTQASYATPLAFNVFDEKNAAEAAANLARLAAEPATSGPTAEEAEGLDDEENIRRIIASQGVLSSGNTDMNFKPWTITTGFSGTPNILPALTKGGYVGEAYNMFSCTDYVSWLYPVTEGATSMWERWNSYDTAFSDPNQNSMNSFNHFALGAVGQWMYEYQLGITTEPLCSDDPSSFAGYQHFVLQPVAGGLFTALEGSYESSYGTIRSAWTADGKGRMTSYSCTVPANTTATLYLPVTGAKAEGMEGVTVLGNATRNGIPVLKLALEPGEYSF